MSETTQMDPLYPILLQCQEIVAGNGFLARVTSKGKALLVKEGEEDWWLYGVEPGGMSEHGKTSAEAALKFMRELRHLLGVFASDSLSFGQFREMAERFIRERNEVEAQRWNEAVEVIRAGSQILDDYVSKLPRLSAFRPCTVQVERLDDKQRPLSPDDNPNETIALPVAA